MKGEARRSDTQLLIEARTCAEPFGVCYERHFASVVAFFRRRVPGPEEAFDLAAETFAAALASGLVFGPGRSRLEPPKPRTHRHPSPAPRRLRARKSMTELDESWTRQGTFPNAGAGDDSQP